MTGPDKGEFRIHKSNYGPLQWSLASPAPGTAARFRRWNVILIAILAFLVLGVFVVAQAPRTRGDTNASWKETQALLLCSTPTPVRVLCHRFMAPADVEI